MASSQNGQPAAHYPSDRRMRGKKTPQRADRRMQRSRTQRERRTRWMVIVVGLAILLLVAGVAAYGYYNEFVAASRLVAARVHDTVYTQGDLVKRMRLFQAESGATGQPIDFSRIPFEYLHGLADAEIIRRAAPRFNIGVTDEDIGASLRKRFSPSPPEGQELRPRQIEREFNERYQDFLERGHLSNADYSKIVEENIYRSRLREKLGSRCLR